MAKFVKIEKLVTKYGTNVEPFIWLNVDNIISVYVKDGLTRIGTIDDYTETTKMAVDEVMELLK